MCVFVYICASVHAYLSLVGVTRMCCLHADAASFSLEKVVCLFLFPYHSAAHQQPSLLSVCTLVLHSRNSPNYRRLLFLLCANILLQRRPEIFVLSCIFAHTGRRNLFPSLLSLDSTLLVNTPLLLVQQRSNCLVQLQLCFKVQLCCESCTFMLL